MVSRFIRWSDVSAHLMRPFVTLDDAGARDVDNEEVLNEPEGLD